MKKIGLVVLVFLLCISIVNAANFEVASEAVKDNIKVTENAKFKIFVKNDYQKNVFRITVTSENWVGIVKEYLLEVPGYSVGSTEIELRPVKDIKIGSNIVGILINSLNEPKEGVQHTLTVYISSLSELVSVDLGVFGSIDPRMDLPLQIKMENNGGAFLDDVAVKVACDVCESKTIYVDLKAGDELVKDLIVGIKDDAKPGSYTLDVTLIDNEVVVGNSVVELNIASSTDVKEKRSVEKSLFVSVLKVVKTNEGNFISRESLVLKIPFFQKLFTKLYPEPTNIINGQYEWIFNVKPGEDFEVTAITDYRTSILVVLILVLVGILVWHFKKGVSIKKRVRVLVEKKSIKGLEVLLSIRNTGKEVRMIRVTDYLPGVVELGDRFSTIKPSRVQKEKERIKVVWDFDRLEEDEERVINYEIKSRLHIIGRLLLPRAEVQFRTKRGKVKNIHSNFFSALITSRK